MISAVTGAAISSLFGDSGLDAPILPPRSSQAHSTTRQRGSEEAAEKYFSGWTAGAGVSVAFAQNWNVFAEYRYTSFGSTTLALPLSELSTTSTTKVSAIELGVNYKFNPRAPAVPVSGVG